MFPFSNDNHNFIILATEATEPSISSYNCRSPWRINTPILICKLENKLINGSLGIACVQRSDRLLLAVV